jgi:hypothetical protein
LIAYWFASGNDFAIQTIANSSPPPAQLTAEQDHQRTLNLLHITSLRRGPDGDPKSSRAANLDESKATSYTNLPDPLLLKRGKKVRSEKIWWKLRRPEIVEDFDQEIYGRVPPNAPTVNWQVTSTTKEMNDGVAVIAKKIIGHVDNSAYPPIRVDIQLRLTTPAQAAGPVLEGPYYDPQSPAYQPMPAHDADKDPGTAPRTSNHRILMKNVECLRAADGTIVITSKHSNIKIDKLTTYVLGPSDLLPVN